MKTATVVEPQGAGDRQLDEAGMQAAAAGASSPFHPARAQLRAVRAQLGYLVHPTERPVSYMYDPPAGIAKDNCEYAPRSVEIRDARGLTAPTSVHREGFELWNAPSAVSDFRDDAAVSASYYEEMVELACAATGAQRGFVFDHQVRKREEGRPPLAFGRHGDGRNPAAVGRVHNDYSEESGRRRLGLVLNDAAAAAVRRYSIVNIWRSIGGAVLDTPLAVCEARSVSSRDLVSGEIRYPNRTGEIYLLEYSSQHCWYYYAAMDRHEALVFKQYDSQVNGVARYTPHAAFELADIPAGAPLRQSIEVRCLVVYD